MKDKRTLLDTRNNVAAIQNSEGPVLVIGAACLDIVGRVNAELRPATSNPAQIRTSYGGVAHNVAENLVRLGQAVTLLTVVGEDSAGDRLLQHASDSGIEVHGVLRTSEHPTGSYLAVISADGVMQYALDDLRIMALLSPTYILQHTSLFREASLVFIDTNVPKKTLRTIFSLARKYHLPVCADPTAAGLANRLKPYLSQLYLITPNSEEAGILGEMPFKASDRRQAMAVARCLVSQGVDIAVITLAEFGVCYVTSETSGHFPAIRTEVVDPTGAGDALSAVMIFALLNNIPLDDAVRLGVSAATLTLNHWGAVLPDLSLEKLYEALK